MRIIHTGDLHLDSSMRTNLDERKRKERKNELTNNFERLSETALKLGVTAIIIAGDLFDTKSVSKTVARAVLVEIEKHPSITYYYLKGNHDRDSFVNYITENGDIPDNLYMFKNEWTKYVLNPEGNKKIVLMGAEFDKTNNNYLTSSLNLSLDDINIVTLHGQENEYRGKDTTDVVAIGSLKGKGIDYLALGHVHEMKIASLDSRGTYAYCGCLEGRGFDECGDHGFILLDVDEEKGDVIPEFVDFAYRKLYTVSVDVSGLDNSKEMADAAKEVLAKERIGERDMVKIELTGEIDEEAEIDTDFIASAFERDYYFIKVKNKTSIKIDYDRFAGDESLKGWFVKLVMEDKDLDDETKGRIVRMGIDALKDGEVII